MSKKYFKSKSPQDVKMSMGSLKEEKEEEHPRIPRNDPFNFEVKEDSDMSKPISNIQTSKKSKTFMAKRINHFQTNKKMKFDDNDGDDDALVEDKSKVKKMKVDEIDDSDNIQYGIEALEAMSQAKKLKVDPHSTTTEMGEKVIALFEKQSKARKKINKTVFEKISEVKLAYELDLKVMDDNVERFKQLSGSIQKCLEQVTESFEAKKKSLNAIQAVYKRLDEMESTQAKQQKKSLIEFENDIKRFGKESKELLYRRMSLNISEIQ